MTPTPHLALKQAARHFTIYLCHACGWIQGEEEDDLACAQCGEPRSFIEEIEVSAE